MADLTEVHGMVLALLTTPGELSADVADALVVAPCLAHSPLLQISLEASRKNVFCRADARPRGERAGWGR